MPSLSPIEILLILAVLLLLFGAKRLPDTARGLGRSLRIFKAETKGLRDDDNAQQAYDPHAHDRAVYDRTIAAQPPVPPVPGTPPAVPPTVPPSGGTDPRQP